MIQIVDMRPVHIPRLAMLEMECFSQPWSEGALSAELQNPQAVFRVALEGNRVVGYVGMHDILGEGYIADIAVFEAYRGRGVGQALWMDIDRYARDHQLRLVTLEVRESNEGAIRFYARNGFEAAGRRKNFYLFPTEDCIIMTKLYGEY